MANIELSDSSTHLIPDFSLRAKENRVPEYVLLSFPNLDDLKVKRGKQFAGTDAFLLGVLADQGAVFQHVTGIEPIGLRVTDFPPFPLRLERSLPLFSIDKSTVKFLRQHTTMDRDRNNNVDPADVKDWFLRSLTLWNRFMRRPETHELITLTSGGNAFELNTKGIMEAWEAAGLPDFANPAIRTELHIPDKWRQKVSKGLHISYY